MSSISNIAASRTNSTNGPTPESLALSASLFTSSISSWIPADFGLAKSDSEKAKDFDLAIREERGGGDRLGLGHPLLDEPRQVSRTGAGLAGLSRKLAGEKKGKGKEDAIPKTKGGSDDEEDEEESRSRSVGKGKMKSKSGVVDMFGGGKKKKRHVVDPTSAVSTAASPGSSNTPQASSTTPAQSSGIEGVPNSANQPSPSWPTNPVEPLSAYPAEINDSNNGNDNEQPTPSKPIAISTTTTPSTPPPPSHTMTSSPGGSGTFPFQGPLALNSPTAEKMLKGKKRALEHDEGEVDADGVEDDDPCRPPRALGTLKKDERGDEKGDDDDEEDKEEHKEQGKVLTKSQLRREKRKRAKLSKAD
ncbi:hypothetical protein IAR55_000189 [Kwoniella newhampshirensis]|uniref:Uncharacterized protein n=1 Tax=Kwoniella newhampshirensis TaxID=1651941 RepID=A0AAW0Z5X9_9TREE